jgi:cytidylate kinase
MKSSQIIALSGPRCCGKSTIANHLVTNHGYTRIAFADALRQIAECGGAALEKDRLYLAHLGEQLRILLPDFLLQVVQNRLQSIEGPVVIEDVRFPSELELCRAIGAMTVRLEIPVETQLNRLAYRDGKTGRDAEQLIDCMDEQALSNSTFWDYQMPAIGDFVELAGELHLKSLNRERSRERVHPFTSQPVTCRGWMHE